MVAEFTASLFDATGVLVSGVFENLDRESAKYLSTHWREDNWWAGIFEPKSPIADEPDYHWNWVDVISRQVLNKPTARSVCLKSPDGAIQGAMVYRIGARSALNPGKKVVYVDRLATAPRNRSNLVPTPRFSRVGECLLRYAMVDSISYGLGGGLTVFPIANIPFYERQGFLRTEEYNKDYAAFLYELPVEAAQETLKMLGVIS